MPFHQSLYVSAILIASTLLTSAYELVDYCFLDSFNATCGPGEVIRLVEARYGRMPRSRCLQSADAVGCWADVLHAVERRCSGRQTCLIPFPDTAIHQLARSCPKGRFAYMRAAYTCLTVESAPHGKCDYPLEVSTSRGYIASSITRERNVGSARCPWVISLPVGQRVNVSIVDFGSTSASESTRHGNCDVIARIREDADASEVPVCRDVVKERPVFLSQGNRVQISVARIADDAAQFLLKYEAVGCTDPEVPRGSTFVRDGNKATVTCGNSAVKQHIACVGDNWRGPLHNCTDPSAETSHHETTALSYEFGIAVAVVAGVFLGVVVGLALLTAVMISYRRAHASARQQEKVLYWQCADHHHLAPGGASVAGQRSAYDAKYESVVGAGRGERHLAGSGPYDPRAGGGDHPYERPCVHDCDANTRPPGGTLPYYGELAASSGDGATVRDL